MQLFAVGKEGYASDQVVLVLQSLAEGINRRTRQSRSANLFTLAAIADNILQQLHTDSTSWFCLLFLPSYLLVEGNSQIDRLIAQKSAGTEYTRKTFRKPDRKCHDVDMWRGQLQSGGRRDVGPTLLTPV